MVIPLINIRDSFGSTLSGKTGVDIAALEDMIRFEDDYNDASFYSFDPSLYDDSYETNTAGYFQLYTLGKVSDGDGGYIEQYIPITSMDQNINSSRQLFVKLKGSDEVYVDIYTLYKLDLEKLGENTDQTKIFSYSSTATRITAILYSANCYQKKLMNQLISDVEAINGEQKVMEIIAGMLNNMQDNLTLHDTGITDADKLHLASFPPEVFLFFVQRGILSVDSSTTGVVTKALLDDVAAVIDGNLKSFQAWAEFSGILKHYDALSVGNSSLPDDFAAVDVDAPAIEDMYNSMYWRKASEMEDNPNKAVVGGGDHWVFDPRIRDAEGRILNNSGNIWDGTDATNCAYFKGFSHVTVASNQNGNFDIYSSESGETWVATVKDEPVSVVTPDFSVVWYGEAPPESGAALEGGIAAMMQGAGLMDSNYILPIMNGAGVVSGYQFSPTLVSNLKNENAQFSVSNTAGKLKVTWGSGTLISAYRTANSNGNVVADYWTLPNGTGGYAATLLTPIKNKISSVKLGSDKVVGFADSLRIYTEQVNGDSSARSSQMQSIQQTAQQYVSLTTNLEKSVHKTELETTDNIR